MKSFKSAPLLVLSAWLIGSTSLCSPVHASCPNCGESQRVSKNNIFRNVRPRTVSNNSIFSNTRTINTSRSSGPIFGSTDCNKNNNPIFGDNNCAEKNCGGAIFGPQTCKKIELPCEDCNTKPTKKAFIQNRNIIRNDTYDVPHNCKDLAPIQLEWVDFRIQDENSESYSRKLGNYRFRLFGCRRNTRNAILNEGRIIQKNMRFIDIFEETVDDCYKINKVPYDLCINKQDYQAPEYILTAEITDYFMNLCDEYNWDTASSEDKRTGSAEMTVTWRLMDLTKSKVLWKGETTGYSELKNAEYNGEIILIEQAFADATSNLKGMPEFEAQLSIRITPDELAQQKATLLALEQAADPIKCKVPSPKAQTCPIESTGGTTSMGDYNNGKQCSVPAELIEYQYDQDQLDAIPLESDISTNSNSICYASDNTDTYSSCTPVIDEYFYPQEINACEDETFAPYATECDPSLISLVKTSAECNDTNLEKAVLTTETNSPRICLFSDNISSSGGISKDSGYFIPETEVITTSKEVKKSPDWQPYQKETVQQEAIVIEPSVITEQKVEKIVSEITPIRPTCIENVAPYSDLNPENLYKVRSSMLSVTNKQGKRSAGLLLSPNQILISAEIIDNASPIYEVETINGVKETAILTSINIKKNTALLKTTKDIYFRPLSLNLQLPQVGNDGYMSLGLLTKASSDNYLDDKGSIKGYRFSDEKGTQIITDTFVQTVSSGGLLIDEKGVINGFAANTYKYNDNGDLFFPILDAINSVGLEVCGQTETFAKAPTAIVKPISTAIDSFKGSKEPAIMAKQKRK